MHMNRDCYRFVHHASRSLHLSLPLLSMIVIVLLALAGGSGLSQGGFAQWRFIAQAAADATSIWKPGLAKDPVYVYASTMRSVGAPGQLDVWDDGVTSAQIMPEMTLTTFAVTSDIEPVLPLILRSGLAQAIAPMLDLARAPVFAPTATPVPTQEPVAALAIIPEPSLTIPQLPPASSAPNRVTSAAIDLDQPVITVGWHQETIGDKVVSVWDVAQYAVGWHKNTKYPGRGGNVVLAGHNNVYGEVFKRLEDLHVGDVIVVHADGRDYEYAVESTVIVKEEGATPEEKVSNARWIGSFPDERLTLVACYPYSGNSHRIIVIARPRFQVS